LELYCVAEKTTDLAKKKATPKKEPRPNNPGFIDQTLLVFDHLISYFELLFVYYRKKFNIGLRRTLILIIGILYCYSVFLGGTGFLVHAGYNALISAFGGNVVYASLVVGVSMLTLSILALYWLLRKIII
jgi:hypothetical protein